MQEINDIFNNPKAGKREIREIQRERTDRTKQVSRQEAREGITTSTEDNLHFFER